MPPSQTGHSVKNTFLEREGNYVPWNRKQIIVKQFEETEPPSWHLLLNSPPQLAFYFIAGCSPMRLIEAPDRTEWDDLGPPAAPLMAHVLLAAAVCVPGHAREFIHIHPLLTAAPYTLWVCRSGPSGCRASIASLADQYHIKPWLQPLAHRH